MAPILANNSPRNGPMKKMNSPRKEENIRGIIAVALVFLVNVLIGASSFAAAVSFPAQNRASGVSWNLVWSNPNQEGHLGVGGSVIGKTGQTTTQLRFDVGGLKNA